MHLHTKPGVKAEVKEEVATTVFFNNPVDQMKVNLFMGPIYQQGGSRL